MMKEIEKIYVVVVQVVNCNKEDGVSEYYGDEDSEDGVDSDCYG